MKLETIELMNFRQYRGTQTASFSMDKEQNVTVFHGLNGAGKTGLFSAINWCLYGTTTEKIGELVNKAVIAEAAEGSPVSASVSMWFRHEGERYLMRRIIEERKISTATVPIGMPVITLSRIRTNGNQDPVHNVTDTMNAIMPSNVRPYFFFDGEKMDDLTKAGNSEVRDAVRNIMRLPALEKAETHLRAIHGEYRRELGKQGSAELRSLIEAEERLDQEKERLIQRRAEIAIDISTARRRVEELQERLRESATSRERQLRRDELKAQIARLEDTQRTRLAQVQEASNRAYLPLLAGVAARALTLLDEKREKGEIPSGVREQVIKDLLERHECLCGRPFSDTDEAYHHLSGLLRRATTGKLEQEVGSLSANIRYLTGQVTQQQETLGHLSRERQKDQDLMDELYDKISEINRQLEGIDDVEIAGLENLRREMQRQLELLVAEEERLKAKVEKAELDKEVISRQKLAAEAKEQRLNELSMREQIAFKATEAVALLKQSFFDETRRTVEAATKDVFGRLAWKQDHFTDVQIDESFTLEVIDRWGMPTRRELSAGERQILSLAFICALSTESGEEAPLVMDTPFGRLSGNHLTEVARNLPGLTPQLILFVTDREWDQASRTQLSPRIGRAYRLDFNEATGCTNIAEVNS